VNQVLRGNTLCSDGAEHQRLRRITARPLTPAALSALTSDITTKAEAIVERLVAKGTFCAVSELAAALPSTSSPVPSDFLRRAASGCWSGLSRCTIASGR
jgi:cytochrome P450